MRPSICKTLHTCVQCGFDFYPKRTDRLTFCSRGCAYRRQADLAHSRKSQKEAEAAAARLARREQAQALRLERARPAVRHISCAICTRVFVVTNISRAAKFCSVPCRKEAKRRAVRRLRAVAGSSQTHRARARRAGVEYVPTNLLAILERDGWRCMICGIPTPKHLRGTFSPTAPEIDHIIPFAQKGPHKPSNLQCACRSCNIAKGAG